MRRKRELQLELMNKDLIGRLRRERERRNLTYHELADLAGLTPNVVRLMEMGKTDPRIGSVAKIAHILGFRMELKREKNTCVRAEISTNNGRRVLKEFRNFDELSEYMTEHHDAICGVAARLAVKEIKEDEKKE